MPLFSSVAALKRAIRVGTELRCRCHGLAITEPDGSTRMSALFPVCDHGVVRVVTVQREALAFAPIDGSTRRSWQRWRPAGDIILTETGFILAGAGEVRMQYDILPPSPRNG